MRTLLTLCFLVCISVLKAQTTASVSGKLVDTVGHQSLKNASVALLQTTDSAVVAVVLATETGSFSIKNIPFGSYLLQMSFQGYQSVIKQVTLQQHNAHLQLGTFAMRPVATQLTEVTVQQSPMVIKKDTVEYNAGSFKTKPNAVVEDLLKKLPGVTVAKDGTVTAHGEQVQRILVDGKRFFGDDPKMATKNLPPDIVDKIQVYDAQSDQSTFTGFDDGSRTKTINITTKKDKRKGIFGKASAGIGNQDRYENSLNMSKFNNGQQITVVGQANNVNRQAFSMQDFLGSVNKGGGGGRGNNNNNTTVSNNNGITTTIAGGINYKDAWSKKVDASGSYFYNHLQVNKATNSLTENIVPNDSSLFNRQTSTSDNTNLNHRFNYNIEAAIDTNNQLIVRPNIAWQQTDAHSNTQSLFNKGTQASTGNTQQATNNQNSGYNGSVEATYRHRFRKKGQSFSVNLTAGGNSNNGNGTNMGAQNNAQPLPPKIIDQVSTSNNHNQNISTNVSFTQPIAARQLLELSYNYSYRTGESNKDVYANSGVDNTYTLSVDSLTNHFNNTNFSHRVGIGYRLQGENYQFNISNGIQFAQLQSNNLTKQSSFNRHFTNLFPTAHFTYNYSRTKSLRINYNGRTNQPSIAQLQPVVDNSSQINVKIGNIRLTQEFNHTFQLRYSAFNTSSFNNFFAFVNAAFTSNKIVNSITQLANGNQRTTYENKNGAYSVSAFAYKGIALAKPKSNLGFTTNIQHSREVGLINGNSSYTYQTALGQTISWTMNLQERFDLVFATTANYNWVRYNLLPQNNANYFSQVVSAEPTYTFKNGWILSADFDYTYNTGRANGYNIAVPLFNASIARQLFKKKEGEIKLSVYDLFSQNQSVTRNVTNNTITDAQNLVLQQYFVLSFTYQLRKFPGSNQGQNPQQNMRNMMRQMYRGGGMGRMP